MTFLDDIAVSRLLRVEEARRRLPLPVLTDRCRRSPSARDVFGRLAGWPQGRWAVIAEVKRRSPSRGELRSALNPGALARVYREAGAFAVSVLTEPDHFGGSLGDLAAVRAAVDLPVLYKDFVIDPYQLWEARVGGADLVLLIAGLLGQRLGEYLRLSKEAGVEPLVEVHDREELDRALAAGARLVGINNRDLRSFRVDLAVSRDLLPHIPRDVVAVSESGLRTPADLEELAALGARAFLIGESVLTAADPGAALSDLVWRKR